MKEGKSGLITEASGRVATMAYDVPLPNGHITHLLAKDINAALSAAGTPTIDFDYLPETAAKRNVRRIGDSVFWSLREIELHKDPRIVDQDKVVATKPIKHLNLLV